MPRTFVILASLAFSGIACTAETPHPWEVRQNILQPIDAGRADLNDLSASNYVPSVDLRLPTRFEKVYRLSDVLRRGSDWNLPPDLFARNDGFVRFSGGVAAVFNFSRYTPSARGRITEIPEGTIFRLDLRPPSPGDVKYSKPGSASYNAVSLDASTDVRSLRTGDNGYKQTAISADLPPVEEAQRSLWTDELYRGRVVSDLLDQATHR